MENIEYKIYKYEQTPVPNPDSNIIGFLITNTDSGKYNNIECTLTLQINSIVERLKNSDNQVVGKVFLPSN